MRVFDLCCEHGHRFEGWFGSEEDYLSQQVRGLVSCPSCASMLIERRPSAPRLNLRSARSEASDAGVRDVASQQDSRPTAAAGLPASPSSIVEPKSRSMVSPTDTGADSEASARMAQFQAAYLGMVQQVLNKTEDVGEKFADEARRIHYGDAAERGIRGQTTPDEVAALHDEGIAVLSLAVPAGLDKPKH